MRVGVFPADVYGCGYHRLIWPAERVAATETALDVRVQLPQERKFSLVVTREGVVQDVQLDDDYDVIVLQRVTHGYLSQAVELLTARGIAVVVDVDDDLAAIHPSNPAWQALHPRRPGQDEAALHSWHYLADACRAATLVTATTPALLARYAPHGRGRLLPNYLAPHYFGHARVDVAELAWPASLHSHPDDPGAVGSAVARLLDDGYRLRALGELPGVARAFGVAERTEHLVVGGEPVDLLDWPATLATLGVAVAPLTATRFNDAKSWLKPLELCAAGVPWVASPRADYRRLHALGAGLLAEKPHAWYGTLRALLTDAARRHELSEAGRAVAADLALDAHAWRWAEAWADARATASRTSEPVRTSE